MAKLKKVFPIVLLLLLIAGLTGCARLRSGIHDLHGSIIGNEYNIDVFDNTGVRTLRSHGKRIDIDNNVVEERTYSSVSDEWYTTKTLSSVITITIDGKQLISCGDTCIFYDKRLVPEYEFYLDSIDSNSSGIMDSTLISGVVNSVKIFREQSLLGSSGGSAQVHETDDRRNGPVYPQSELPGHRQGAAGLKDTGQTDGKRAILLHGEPLFLQRSQP